MRLLFIIFAFFLSLNATLWGFETIREDIEGQKILLVFDDTSSKLVEEFLIREQKIVYRCFYEYDSSLLLLKKIVDNGSSRAKEILTDVTERTIFVFHYNLKYSNLIPWEVEAIDEIRGTATIYSPSSNSSVEITNVVWDSLEAVAGQAYQWWKQEVATTNDFQTMIDRAMKEVLGEFNLFMWGLYPEKLANGVQGHGEISDKVRVTGINGILNSQIDCIELATRLSQFHGGINVHYTYWASQGWTQDMLKCFLAKGGYVSSASHALAENWRNRIAEMGGVGNGGLVIHYAHSIGGTETSCAMQLMTPEELAMIRVYTFGSATMIPNGHCESITNYVSRRDGVSMLDPSGYLRGFYDSDSNIIFIGDHYGPPLVDHSIINETYVNILKILGKNFVDEWGSLIPVTEY